MPILDLGRQNYPRMPFLAERSLRGIAEYILSDACKSVVLLTGAGVSVASGVPDFRSAGGLYDTMRTDLITANAKQNVRSRMADVMNNINLTSEEALPASRHAHATLSLPLVARAGQKRHQGAQGVRQPPQGRGRADQRQTPRHRHGGTTPSTRRATGFF